MTELVWDPSGRYVSTSVNTFHETDNGYYIWTFQGRNLIKYPTMVVSFLYFGMSGSLKMGSSSFCGVHVVHLCCLENRKRRLKIS